MAHHQNEWRKRQVILPEEIVRELYAWHGGQGSSVYSLASTGHENLVSLSQIDVALIELEQDLGKMSSRHDRAEKKDRKDLRKLIGDLDAVRLFWWEHSAKEAGLESDPDFEYEYDKRDYGMNTAEESEISVRSG